MKSMVKLMLSVTVVVSFGGFIPGGGPAGQLGTVRINEGGASNIGGATGTLRVSKARTAGFRPCSLAIAVCSELGGTQS